jgi:hypothetical protein
MTKKEVEAQKELLELIAGDPRMAHELLFEHRHPNETPEFHGEIIDIWHDHTKPKIAIQAFRGGAKSTVGCEEATLIMALLGVFKNGLIIGEKYERAVERLDAIKYEIENNEVIHDIFGDCKGKIWKEGKIELANGTVIQAIGRGQSMRGSKHRDQRPDYMVGDDIEDMDSVRTEEAKRATLAWLMSVVIPAMDKNNHTMRIIGTPLEVGSLMETLVDDSGWEGLKIPIEYKDEKGDRKATWEDRFPLPDVDKIKSDFERLGLLLEYGREYMCEARSSETQVFKRDMILIEPRVRRWESVYAMFDPARTKDQNTSDHTGMAVWSYIGNKVHWWETRGHFWSPSDFVEDLFRVNEKYNPVLIGIEQTGLEDWLMEPVRKEMLKRSCILPVRPMKAPRGKIDFIKGMQPYFAAGEVTFQDSDEDTISQLLNFPAPGRDDIPNAMAYFTKLKPGMPVFEDFCDDHVLVDYVLTRSRTYVAVNYEVGVLTAVLYQKNHNGTVVIGDIILEGDPQQRASDLLEISYGMCGGSQNCDIIVHPSHYEKYSASGLAAALRKAGADPRKGGDIIKGRQYLVEQLRQRRGGQSTFKVWSEAQYVLNAFAGGYAFERKRAHTGLQDRANEGMYRTLMEGFECSLTTFQGVAIDADANLNYARDKRTGKLYHTTRPGRG